MRVETPSRPGMRRSSSTTSTSPAASSARASSPSAASADLAAAAAFYRDHFGYRVSFQVDWYVSLARDNHELAVLDRDHQTIPEGCRGRSATGVLLNLEVDDVDAVHANLADRPDIEIVLPLRSEDFGQRHFIIAPRRRARGRDHPDRPASRLRQRQRLQRNRRRDRIMRPAAGNAGTRDATNALTRWLTADAIVTGLNAAAYLALAGWLTTLLGSGDGVLRGIGVFLMAFTVLVLVASVTRSTALAVVVVATNVVWVVAA